MAKLRFWGIQMSRASYSHIECGRGNVRIQELLALAEIFEVEPGDFFKGIRLEQVCVETSDD